MPRLLAPVAAARIPPDVFIQGLMAALPTSRHVEAVYREFQACFGVKHLFSVSSGKAALTLALRAMQSLSPRRKVILPAYTCFSVPAAVMHAGLTVVLCDVDPETLDFYPDCLAALLDEETLCVVVTHLFGLPANVDRVRSLCDQHGVFVIEDAAQAMGTERSGKKLGTQGDIGIFSLGRGKNLTCGSGGVILTNHDALATSLKSDYDALASPGSVENSIEFLKLVGIAFFIRPHFYPLLANLPWLKLGETFFEVDFEMKRLSRMKMGLLWGWRERLDVSNRVRATASGDYLRRLNQTPILPAIPCLRFPVLLPSRSERDRFYREMKPLGVGTMYPTALHFIPALSGLFSDARYPGAEEIAERLLTLPTHAWVSEKDRERICHRLMTFNPTTPRVH
jgi:dTDP-4-amino-4,6-dideoxygalactose transaminase